MNDGRINISSFHSDSSSFNGSIPSGLEGLPDVSGSIIARHDVECVFQESNIKYLGMFV